MSLRACAARAVISSLAMLLLAFDCEAAPPPAPAVFFASLSGRPTLDQGEGGGNPFASALVELLLRPDVDLGMLPSELRILTNRKSRGFQVADGPSLVEPSDWRFQSPPAQNSKLALVAVFSNYTTSAHWPALPGARRDAHRVSAALEAAGFDIATVVDPTRAELSEELRRFRQRSTTSDFAIVYTTGHGVEVDSRVYLLPDDYPFSEGKRALDRMAVPLARFVSSARARRVNLVFYGGCRDNPFDKE